MKKLFSFFAAMLVAFAANATVINITNETPDALRTALNSAADGDEIVMAAGTYVESNSNYIAFDGKAVTVKAAESANVIIQPQVPITVSNGGHAIFENVKIDASRLQELATWYEHLLYVTDGQPNGCTFRGCEIYGYAVNNSMFYCSNANKVAAIKFDNCFFHDIMKSIIFVENTEGKPMVSVKNCTFANISTNTESYYAGVIDLRAAEATLQVDHCTFYNVIPMNTDYSAVSKIALAKGTVSNCIFMLPTALDNIRAMRGVKATNCITFNYLKDSGTGIHSSVTQTNCQQVDPLFVNAAEGNFTLSKTSPAMTMNDGQPIGDPRWIPSEEPAEPQTLYLKPGVWYYSGNNEKFAMYAYEDGKPEYWSEFMALADKETEIWTGTIPAGYTNVIFVRFANASTTPSWSDNMWNKTFDLKITEGKDFYTISGWGDGEGAPCPGNWSKYEYVEPAKFYITGDSALVVDAGLDKAKAWNPDAIKSMEASYKLNLKAGVDYMLKITLNGTWDGANNVKGYDEMTTPKNGLYRGEGENANNICFKLNTAGEVTVHYDGEFFFLIGDFYVVPEPEKKYYLKNNWNGGEEWTWKELVKNTESGYYQLDDVVFGGKGVNINTAESDEGATWIAAADIAAMDMKTYEMTTLGALDTVAFVFDPEAVNSYTGDNGLSAFILGKYVAPAVPELANGYYLIGLKGWDIYSLAATDKFEANGEVEGEYVLKNVVLVEGQKFKVIEVKDKALVDTYWYGSGDGNVDYNVTADVAGTKDVYFRPVWETSWNGHIYVELNTPTAIDNTDAAVKAVKMIQNGQLVIFKNGVRYNAQGQAF